MRGRKGFLICIEGIDKSGKTTQTSLLALKLRGLGLDVLLSREPTDGPVGRLIKRLLRGRERPPAVVEAVLFALDRYWHVEEVVRPALEAGKVVVLDRYYYSSLAYQGSAGLPLKWLRELNSFAPEPDLAIYLDVDPRESLARATDPRTVLEKLPIQEAVRRVYLELVRAGELMRVNAMRPIEEVARDVLSIAMEKLRQRGLLRP